MRNKKNPDFPAFQAHCYSPLANNPETTRFSCRATRTARADSHEPRYVGISTECRKSLVLLRFSNYCVHMNGWRSASIRQSAKRTCGSEGWTLPMRRKFSADGGSPRSTTVEPMG